MASSTKRPAAIATPYLTTGQIAFTTQKGDSVICHMRVPFKPLAAQFGGYGSTQRTGRRGRTTYQGVDVAGMSGVILLDGWGSQQAVTPDKRALEAMASPSGPGERTPPQPVFVTGTVPIGNRWWVIQALELGDDVLLRERDGVCLRQDYTVTLIDPPDDVVIITNGKRYTVRKGDTLLSIAARQLGDAKRWREITDSKGHRIRDPKNVRPDQVVKLP